MYNSADELKKKKKETFLIILILNFQFLDLDWFRRILKILDEPPISLKRIRAFKIWLLELGIKIILWPARDLRAFISVILHFSKERPSENLFGEKCNLEKTNLMHLKKLHLAEDNLCVHVKGQTLLSWFRASFLTSRKWYILVWVIKIVQHPQRYYTQLQPLAWPINPPLPLYSPFITTLKHCLPWHGGGGTRQSLCVCLLCNLPCVNEV